MKSDPPHIEFIARGVLIEEGRVLLCQNVKKGYWYLPGGHVEFGESAAAALRREFKEETGAHVVVGEPALVNEGHFRRKHKPSHEINVVFPVERPSRQRGRPIRSLEKHVAFGWFNRRQLRSIDLRPDPIAAWLRSSGWKARNKCEMAWRSDW